MKKIFISLLIALAPAFAFMSCTEDSPLIDLENESTDDEDEEFDPSGLNFGDDEEYDFFVDYNGQTLYFKIDETAENECYVTEYDDNSSYDGVVEIPSQVTYNGTTYTVSGIGKFAFDDTHLTSVSIPSTVKRIEISAFCGTQLTSIAIPSSVEYIGESAFSSCNDLKEIIVEDGNTTYTAIDGVLYTKDMSTLVVYPNGKTDADFTVESRVDSIDGFAFDENDYLKNLMVESNTVALSGGLFSNCKNLSSVSVRDDNPQYTTVDGALYNKDTTELVLYPRRKNETDFTIPTIVKKIKSLAFCRCDNLRTITMQDGLIVIQRKAFYNCLNLESVVIPSTTRQIMKYGFEGCNNLSSIKIYVTEPFEIESDAFDATDEDNDDYGLNYRNATLYVPAGTKSAYQNTDCWNRFENIVEMEE